MYACMFFMSDYVECLDPQATKLALLLRTLDPSQQGKLDLKERILSGLHIGLYVWGFGGFGV